MIFVCMKKNEVLSQSFSQSKIYISEEREIMGILIS